MYSFQTVHLAYLFGFNDISTLDKCYIHFFQSGSFLIKHNNVRNIRLFFRTLRYKDNFRIILAKEIVLKIATNIKSYFLRVHCINVVTHFLTCPIRTAPSSINVLYVAFKSVVWRTWLYLSIQIT